MADQRDVAHTARLVGRCRTACGCRSSPVCHHRLLLVFRLLWPVARYRMFGWCPRLIALRSAFTPWLPHHKPPARIARPVVAPVGSDGHAECAAACPVPPAD